MVERVTWVWVSLPWATFGVAVRGERVVDAAPIARWTVGKPWSTVVRYYRRKGATIKTPPAAPVPTGPGSPPTPPP